MKSEQRARCDAEIFPARLAAEPQRARRATALINGRALAVWADRFAISPSNRAEHILSFLVSHAKDGAQGERPGLC